MLNKKKGKGSIELSESFGQYLSRMSKETGKSQGAIIEDTFRNGIYIIEEAIPEGQATLKFLDIWSSVAPKLAGEPPKSTSAQRKIYRGLAERFGPVTAGIQWAKAFTSGSGFNTVVDDPEDKIKIRNKEQIDKLNGDIYQDYYTRGLDRVLDIMLEDTFVDGFAAAEIVYDGELKFDDYGRVVREFQPDGSVKEHIEIDDINWSKHKSVARLKIIENAVERLNPKRDPKSFEVLYSHHVIF